MSRASPHARSPIFSDSWHRVAELRCVVRRSVSAQKQTYQGEQWVVLRDTLSNDWFRISMPAYRFISRLTMQRNVEQVWQESLQADHEQALTQEEVVQLLGQLNLSNLLQYDRTPSAASVFERYAKRRRQEIKALLMGFLAIKIPLWDPDALLARARPLTGVLLGPFGLLLYMALLLAGLIAVLPLSDALMDESSGVLAPDNLFLLYVGFLIAKGIHELGHAAVCKYYGGEVHTIGVMLLVLAPLPYVDASSSWGFRSSRQRFFVGMSGMLSEFAVAAAAALVWANTAPGTLNALAYNVMFVASVSSLVFNLNPLLRFDGYHMLVDLLEMPNLYQRSRTQLTYLCERFLFGLPTAQPAAMNRREVLILPLYGLASLVYWVFLMIFIAAFVAQEYRDLGIAIVFFLVITTVLLPLGKFVRFLLASPRLAQHRRRAWTVTGTLLGGGLLLVGGVQAHDYVRVLGVIEAERFSQLHAESAGELVERFAQPGDFVHQGMLLVRLQNPQMVRELEIAKQELQGLLLREQRSVAEGQAELRALQDQRVAAETRIATLENRLAGLAVRAPVSGVWVSGAEFEPHFGQWIKRGDSLGQIVNPETWRFVGVLPQVDSFLLETPIQGAELRLRGVEQHLLTAAMPRVIPHDNGLLPSASLGMAGGGPIAVDPSDGSGRTAAEPFFRVEASVGVAEQMPMGVWVHGKQGVMRVQMQDAPLLHQWERRVRQFLQRTFRV